MSIDIALMIQKQGSTIGSRGKDKTPVREVCCSKCGGKIRSDNAECIEYIETKRGTKMFFHRKCLERMRKNDD